MNKRLSRSGFNNIARDFNHILYDSEFKHKTTKALLMKWLYYVLICLKHTMTVLIEVGSSMLFTRS